MHFEPSGIHLDFQDVLIKPKRSTINSRKDIDLFRQFSFKYSPMFWRGIPIISANMDSVTNYNVMKIMTDNYMLAGIPKVKICLKKFGYSSIETCGLDETPRGNTSFIAIDCANGYQQRMIEKVEQIRKKYFQIIIAGNVVTPEMTEALILAGADIVKIGIGSGASCATRLKTAVGYPQLSAVIECADAAHGLGAHIISDGGCTTPADVCKAFGAGADFVMLGGMLAGHDENGSEFYGMSSKKANDKYNGGLKDYRASEGLELRLPNRGPLKDTLQDITGGLRSCCAYVGAKRLKDLPKCCTFVQVSRQLNTSLHQYREDM